MKKKTAEPRGFNLAAERTNAGLRRARRRLRLSLTLRIAAHYCGQLARTFLLSALVLTLVFAAGNAPRIAGIARRVAAAAPDLEGGGYSQLILQDAGATAALTARQMPEETGERIAYTVRILFDGMPTRLTLPVKPAEGSGLALVRVSLREPLTALGILLCGAVLADLLRMLYFLRHRHNLDKRVLAPIREMTEMARTLSAANLSNRINVAGMKNELQELAEVINSMLDRIERSYNSQKQFVSDASHELRTPIAVIQGYADMLRRWGKDDPEVLAEGIEAISQETSGMKDLVESLLFLARHDKKTLMLEIASFDAADVLREVQREAALVTPGGTFLTDPCEASPIEGDRGMVKQVLRILVDNAVKYSPEGSTVTLGVRRTADGCVLSVADQGCGIPEEELPKIFERFYRADAARHSETGGHGLGLSIARIIVVAHGGKLRVRSKVGSGTIFEIELPAVQRKEAERPAEEAPPQKKKRKRRMAA